MEDDVQKVTIVDGKKSGLATASMILGIISIIGSWIPFLNVFSIFIGFVGLGLGIPSLIIYFKKKKGSLAKSVSGLVLCILTLIIGISMNNAAVDSIDKALGSDADSKLEFAYGEAAELDGVSIKVLDVEHSGGYTENYISVKPDKDGNEFVIINVELKNNSDETKTYNVLDFELQTGNGDIQSSGFSMYDTGSDLDSGSLASGGTKTGKIVFEVPKGDNKLMMIYKGNWIDSKERKFKLQ